MKILGILMLALVLAASVALAADHGHGLDGKALYAAKCQSCHGADGSKALLSKPVKGLKPDAVATMMRGYKAKTYGGTKKATMENLAQALSDDEIKAVAAFIGTL